MKSEAGTPATPLSHARLLQRPILVAFIERRTKQKGCGRGLWHAGITG